MLLRFYRTPGLHSAQRQGIREQFALYADGAAGGQRPTLEDLETEYCYYVETERPLESKDIEVLRWLLRETFEGQFFSQASFIKAADVSSRRYVFEIGPRLNFATPWSTNAVAICKACGLDCVTRIERARRIALVVNQSLDNTPALLMRLHDRMTECIYDQPLSTLKTAIKPAPWVTVPVLAEGSAALERINREMGLAFDDWDIRYYTDLFANKFKRDPTSVECFDLSQSNSEHSRHWYFKGRLVIDGEEVPHTLFQLVMQTQEGSAKNSVIAFRDNSSSIKGFNVTLLLPSSPGTPSALVEKQAVYNITFTAETHNFPTGVAPFPG